jgi:hypothetical protein
MVYLKHMNIVFLGWVQTWKHMTCGWSRFSSVLQQPQARLSHILFSCRMCLLYGQWVLLFTTIRGGLTLSHFESERKQMMAFNRFGETRRGPTIRWLPSTIFEGLLLIDKFIWSLQIYLLSTTIKPALFLVLELRLFNKTSKIPLSGNLHSSHGYK